MLPGALPQAVALRTFGADGLPTAIGLKISRQCQSSSIR